MAHVHLINSFQNLYGGSEREALGLFEELDPLTDVSLWCEAEPDSKLAGKYPIRRISKERQQFPRGGNLVFTGAFFSIGGWVAPAQANRIIIIFNTPEPNRLRECLAGFSRLGRDDVEVVFVGRSTKEMLPDLNGPIHPSPIDISRFYPTPERSRQFTVGRVSRDIDYKHHPEDPSMYRKLAEAGFKVRILGGTCLMDRLYHPNIELLPEGAEDAAEFLRGLDAFVYRTDPTWHEAFGRVVAEAMCTGLPVIVENRAGPREYIEEGKSGLLVNSTEEMYRSVIRVREDPSLRRRLGQQARRSMEELFSADSRAEALQFYTQTSRPETIGPFHNSRLAQVPGKLSAGTDVPTKDPVLSE